MRLISIFCTLLPLSLLTEPKTPIHLIWVGCDPKESWEQQWIHELFEFVPHPIVEHVDPDLTMVIPFSVLIFSVPNRPKLNRLLETYSLASTPFALLQLSDEELLHTDLDYHDARFILRNYFSKKLARQNKKVYFIPLGYKNHFWRGFEGKIKGVNERKYNWSFAGNINRPDRLKMARYMGYIPGYFFNRGCGFNSKNALSTSSYRDLLLDTIISPCPIGNASFDSFRVYESLECGCIPLIQSNYASDYFKNLFGEHPLPILQDWSEAKEKVDLLLKDKEALENLRQVCYQFWQDQKIGLKNKIRSIIETHFFESDGESS